MALTLGNGSRNAACNGVVDLVDAGDTAGTLKIYTAGGSGGGTLLCTVAYADPAFGSAGSVGTGVATAFTMVDGTCVASGTAAAAEIYPSTGTAVITGLTVGTSGSDINLTNTTIATGDIVGISSFTVTMPAA